MQDLVSGWDEIKNKVKTEFEMTDVAYTTFIDPLKIKSIANDTVYIMIPFDQSQGISIDYYNKKYLVMFQVSVQDITGLKYNIVFVNKDEEPEELISESNMVSEHGNKTNNDLKEDYTFDTFVVGKNNEFAHSAALAVAENPGHEFNPLFLYGGPGVGKTHLMHAIGNYIRDKNPSAKVLYVTSEAFTNEVVQSIKAGSQAMEQLRQKYRNVDALLLDDIQFIIGKESTQLEFFHTFNELYSANKAIIISSDKPPKDMKTLEERLKSRFESGLTADINPPDYETRAAILKKYSERYDLELSDEIIDYVASNIRSNIRELTGAFNKLKLISKTSEITLETVQYQIKDYINEGSDHKITMEMIVNEVCNYYNITIDDINSKQRSQDITHPRQVATFLCRDLTDNSQELIGKAVGNRDHSTVINSINKIRKEIENNTNTKAEIEEIKKRLSRI